MLAVQRIGIGCDQRDPVLGQFREGKDPVVAEIDQPFGCPIADRAPAVLTQQEIVVFAPARVLPGQPPQHPRRGLDQCGQGDGVVQPWAGVADPGFQGRKLRRGAQIPPDFAGVLDDVQFGQRPDRAFEFTPAAQFRRQAGARHVPEHRRAIRGKPGILGLPERTGGRQRQKMRQEIRDLVHQVYAHVRIRQADMHMHPADQHAPRHRGHVA